MKKPDVLLYEKKAWASGFLRVAGVDEAGRGPLAGPVVAAAVAFEREYIEGALISVYERLTDSKIMSETSRREFYDILQDSPEVVIGLGIVHSDVIDQINILNATHKAMAGAADKTSADCVLVDGLPVKGLPCESESIVKGDLLSISISAASIIAKVTRDRWMVAADTEFPEYGFSRHKGYGTKQHLEALQRYGACPIHRKTFRPVAELNQLDMDI